MLCDVATQPDFFDEDDEIDDAPVVRRVVRARDVAPPVCVAPRSVFDLAKRPVHLRLDSAPDDQRVVGKIEQREGVTRFTGAAYPVRWTQEDEARERLRRARQRPPRPTRKAKTRSAKLLEMIGDPDD